MNISEKFENEKAILTLSGRLDANSCIKLKESINNSLNKGKVDFILDFEDISEISSSAEDFLIKNYHNLVQKHGSLLVINTQNKIKEIFNNEKLSLLTHDNKHKFNFDKEPLKKANIENINFKFYDAHINVDDEKNTLLAYGNPNKLINKSFLNQDPFILNYNNVSIGLGLGALSMNIQESIDVFGEYLNIGRYAFHIPSFKDSVCDYEICEENSEIKINDLYGMMSKNKFKHLALFEGEDESKSLSISCLLKVLMSNIEKKAIQFVLFGEIDKTYGAKLIKSPYINKKENIFEKNKIDNTFKIIKGKDNERKICAIVGYAINDANPLIQKYIKNYDKESQNFLHAHCVTFGYKKLTITDIDNTDTILRDIMNNSGPLDLFHLIKNDKTNEETSLYNGACFFDSLDEFKTGEF